MAKGDKIFISPDLTHQPTWIEGKIIDVENNPFVGVVISAQTPDGNIYFDKEYNFKTTL
ncbi:MAG: transcriptional regulator [Paludibacteraceae bacterium]|nr:transcriptional regulator [Paludibacteraceae bacterium]